MCGIVGYIGKSQAAPVLLQGLEKLEYRGYDSAGIAILSQGRIDVEKYQGRLSVLAQKIDNGCAMPGCVGIGHTRWATHGEPSDVNSHPHLSKSGRFAVVHNGIIENYIKLKESLVKKGFAFLSDTDTEVLAHLVELYYNGDMVETMQKLMMSIEGSYAIGVLCVDEPDAFYAVRKDSPLIVGVGNGENFIASDIPAILKYTRDVYFLNDKEIVVLKADSVTIINEDNEVLQKQPYHVEWDVAAAEKCGYEHFMIKEIMEQPKAILDTLRPRLQSGAIEIDKISLTKEDILGISKIFIVACGSAYYVGVAAKYIFEKLTGTCVEVDIASEFRYRNPILDKNTLVLIISQSGETADTLAALREAKRCGCRILSIVNVVGSSIARESHDVFYTWAGPEIAVATTKAYSTQLVAVYLLALHFAQKKGRLDQASAAHYFEQLMQLDKKVAQCLENKKELQFLASRYYNSKDVFFLGRGLDYAVALEGSLKFKEISYIHSDAYAAGELKHGPISLIEKNSLVVVIATQERLFDKTISAIREVKARGAVVVAIAFEGNNEISQVADYVVNIPRVCELFAVSAAVIPLQLLSYYVACEKGCDVDKPRNLAKSVTVE